MNLSLAPFGHARVMGNQQQGRVEPRLVLEQAVDNEATGGGIEIAGRLIGKKQFWAGNKSASDCYTLLLPPRQLSRVVAQAMTEANRRETLPGGCERVASTAELQR